MSEITKKALANSLKKLMKEKPLAKITVNDIVKECGLSRRTLYYYFDDLYDLLEWIFITDILEVIGENKTYKDWQKGFLSLLYYLRENKEIILNAYHSIDRDRLELHLYDTVAKLIYDVVEELSQGIDVSEEDKDYVVRFYEIALTGVIIDWIKNRMTEEPETLTYKLNKIIEGDIKRALMKFEKNT